jgi:Protein kinase domain
VASETPAAPEKVDVAGPESALASPSAGETAPASNAAPAPSAAAAAAAVPASASSSSSLAIYDTIQSPDGHSEIVERSPGGRYVRFAEKLGSGASKDVYRAYDTQEGIEVAWNVVNLSGVPKSERNRIVNEVRLLERLHHHNIISFHGSWVNRERQEVNFVTEILSSGTLKSFINKVQVIRWKIAKRWAAQILQGLNYLHSQDPPVIHRDLKCENIFINGTSGDLRIGDLGLSTVHRNNGRVLSVLGTPEFMVRLCLFASSRMSRFSAVAQRRRFRD